MPSTPDFVVLGLVRLLATDTKPAMPTYVNLNRGYTVNLSRTKTAVCQSNNTQVVMGSYGFVIGCYWLLLLVIGCYGSVLGCYWFLRVCYWLLLVPTGLLLVVIGS